MSDLTERDIQPMADEDIAKLKAAVTARWDDKPHYVAISPGCMMRAAEILSLIKAYEDMKDDYLRRHKDACDRFLEIDRLTAKLAEAQKDRDYWKVEAEGERAKVERRDKQLDRIAASIAEQVMIMDGQKCRLIIGFETPAKTQEAFDALGDATGWVKATPPARALKEKP